MNSTPGAQVLVVEDSVELNNALCDILSSRGYCVRGAYDGFGGLEQLRTARPDVVLCDVMMPGMDGYALLQAARSDASLRSLPFIFLTAYSSHEGQWRARELGIDDYLTKPVDGRDLVIAIESALNRYRRMVEDGERKLDELRNRIVGLLQHEFRTPLTFVLGYAELIAGITPTNLDWDELRLAAASILEGGRRLERLIESFLLLAELQNRTLKPGELEALDAVLLCETVAQELAGAARAAKLTLDVLHPRLPAFVVGDEYLITECLRRLIDNALRYRRPQSTGVAVSTVSLPPYVGLRVLDDGSGLSEAEVADIMQPFESASRGDTAVSTGAGLGLAVVKHIAQLHGGRLQVVSTQGQGSTFTLWLPAASTEDVPVARK